MHTIRVVNYLGDYDDMDEMILIGPYATADERNAALLRLEAVPGVRGNLTFHPSVSNPLHADVSASAWQVAEVNNLDELVEAIWAVQ